MNLNNFVSKGRYNLLVNAKSAIDKDVWVLQKDRFLERTSENILREFSNVLSSGEFKLIESYPTLILPELSLNEKGFIGYLDSIRLNSSNAIEFYFKRVHEIDVSFVNDNAVSFDLRKDYDLYHSYFSIKNIDLIDTLSKLLPNKNIVDVSPKIFLSWSKDKSKKYAERFKGLIKKTLGLFETSIFISSQSIDVGEDWWQEIKGALSSAQVGVIFVTDENYDSPWLNYETGILQSKFEKNMTFPVTTSTDANSFLDKKIPLTQFQLTKALDDIKEMKKLIVYIAKSIELDIDTDEIELKIEDNWRSYLTDDSSPVISDFKDTIKFWLPKVEKAWQLGTREYMVDSIVPPSSSLNSWEFSNVPDIKAIDKSFDEKLLKINNEGIIIKFNENGRLSNIYDSSITWIPDSQDGTWFIAILYDNKNRTVSVQYINKSVNKKDTGKFREHMKLLGKKASYKVDDLGLFSPTLTESLKSLYLDFIQTVAHARRFNK